jgi:hypothetical protein
MSSEVIERGWLSRDTGCRDVATEIKRCAASGTSLNDDSAENWQ